MTPTTTAPRIHPKHAFTILLIIYFSYIALGLTDSVLSVAWSGIRQDLSLPLEHNAFLIVTSLLSYSFTSALLGKFSKYLSSDKLAFIGILFMVGFNLLFALGHSLPFLMVAITFISFGSGLLDSSFSSYMAKHYSATYVNWSLSLWGLGASLSPILMTTMIDSFNWRVGYVSISFIQLIAAVVIGVSVFKGIWVLTDSSTSASGDVSSSDAVALAPKRTKRRVSVLQLVIFITTTGMQSSVGIWIFSVVFESRGLSLRTAGLYPTFYFASIMLGRMFFGLVARRYKNMILIRFGLGLALLSGVLLYFHTSLIWITALGLGISPLFPCLVQETSNRFHRSALDRQMGFQISASGFGELITAGMGYLLQFVSLEALFPATWFLIVLNFVINELIDYSVD